VPPLGTLPQNNLPVARFTTTPTTAIIQQAVVFDASGSTDEGSPCADLCTYDWDFGNGSVSSGRITSQAFAVAGTYTVRLRVTDSRGGQSVTTGSIVITAPTFTVDFSLSPTAPRNTQQVNFDAGGTVLGPGASIIDYSWNWGDGTTEVTTVPTAAHTYTVSAATTFVVRLTVRDTLNRTATVAKTVTVSFP
jgi:PKD repeat protein